MRLQDEGGSCRFLSFSPDGRFLASTNQRDEVREFDLATGDVVWDWAHPELLSTSLGMIVWPFCPLARDAWSNGQWKLTNVPGMPRGWPGDTGALFAPDGGELAIVHNPCLSNSHVVRMEGAERVSLYQGVWLIGAYLHFFDDPDMRLRTTVEVEKPQQLPMSTTILHGLSAVTAFAYSPDGSYAVTGSSDGILTMWNVEAGTPTARVQAEWVPEEGPRVNSVAFSPDGRHVASLGMSGTLRLWSAPLLTAEGELTGHTQPGFWVAFSPDGSCLASAAWDQHLLVWDPVTRMRLYDSNWLERAGQDPAFAYAPRGGGVLFGATRNGAVAGMLSDGTGAVEYRVELDLQNTAAFALSQDGRRVALSDREGHILVWQVG